MNTSLFKVKGNGKTPIREVPGSNLGLNTSYLEGFHGLHQYLQGKYLEGTSIFLRPHPSKSLPIRPFLRPMLRSLNTTMPFNAMGRKVRRH
jgi:hypothetical protein